MYHTSTAAAGFGTGVAGALAFTGAYSLLVLAVGLSLVTGGLVLVAATRRGGKRRGTARGGSVPKGGTQA